MVLNNVTVFGTTAGFVVKSNISGPAAFSEGDRHFDISDD
jgi:hypothetical protein